MALLAAGLCVLVVWVFVRLLRPEKFLLRRVPGRPNGLHILHVLTVYMIFWVATNLALSVAAAVQGVKLVEDKPVPVTVSLPAMFAGQLVMIIAVLTVAAMTFRHGLGRGFGLSGRHWISDVGRGVAGYLATLPLCIMMLFLAKFLLKWLHVEPSEHPYLEFLPSATPMWRWLVFFGAVVLAPVAEELFFRGLLQSLLRKHLGGPWPAILATSVIFAAAHYHQPQGIPSLFVLSVALGYNYERTGRLISPILIHVIFNAAMLWQKLG